MNDRIRKDYSALPEPMRHALLDAEAINSGEAGLADNKQEKAPAGVPDRVFFWDVYSIHGTLPLPETEKEKEK